MSDYVSELRKMGSQILSPHSEGKRFFEGAATEIETLQARIAELEKASL